MLWYIIADQNQIQTNQIKSNQNQIHKFVNPTRHSSAFIQSTSKRTHPFEMKYALEIFDHVIPLPDNPEEFCEKDLASFIYNDPTHRKLFNRALLRRSDAPGGYYISEDNDAVSLPIWYENRKVREYLDHMQDMPMLIFENFELYKEPSGGIEKQVPENSEEEFQQLHFCIDFLVRANALGIFKLVPPDAYDTQNIIGVSGCWKSDEKDRINSYDIGPSLKVEEKKKITISKWLLRRNEIEKKDNGELHHCSHPCCTQSGHAIKIPEVEGNPKCIGFYTRYPNMFQSPLPTHSIKSLK